jgi:uncharacterized protein YcbX
VLEGDGRPIGEPIPVQLYDRVIPVRRIDETLTRALRERIGDETLTLARVDEPEYAGGGHRVSIVSRASVADVGAHLGDDGLDARRFRMLIEVDGVDAFAEDAWQGRRLRIGEAVVRVAKRMNRCVMTTLDPDTGVQDAPVLDALASYRKVGVKLLIGVKGEVERPGRIALGDAVEPLDDRP